MMSSIKHGMMKHPVIAFFVLIYGISWPLFTVTLFLFPGNMAIQGTLGSIAGFMPVISGIVISSVSDHEAKKKQGIKRPVAFLIAWLFSTLVLVLFLWQVRGVQVRAGIIFFGGLLALLPAFVLSGAFSGRTGLRAYLSTLIRPRGHVVWYLLALFTFPVIQLTGYAVTRFLGQDVGEVIQGGFGIRIAVIIVLTFFYGFLFAGGINEESGWRGFALPRLQARYPVIVAAGIVWLFWALWHLPYDMGLGTPVSGILINRLFHNLLWSILFAWVYNRSGGSILAPALFHPSMNTFGEVLPRTNAAMVLFIALTLFAIISDRMWHKLPGNHPAVHME